LNKLQGDKLLKSTPAQLEQLLPDAQRLLTDNVAAVNPAVVQKIPQLNQLLPVDWTTQNPVLAGLLKQIGALAPTDYGNTAQSLASLLTTITHYLPGLGGSVPMLLIGLAGMWFTNQITQARTRDHVTAKNAAR
jgi:hypothetical protein